MWKSFAEFAPAICKVWWVMLLGITAALAGAGLDISDTTGIVIFEVPHWLGRLLWISGLVIIGLLAPFLAFHKVRLERDKLQERLDSQTTLWISGRGVCVLTDTRKLTESDARHLGWYFDVNIANASPDKNLGIRSIVLELKRGNTLITLRAIKGKLESEFSGAPEGTISGVLTLQPSEAISGTLVFEEIEWGNRGSADTFDTAIIVLIDSQDREHRFDTMPDVLTNR